MSGREISHLVLSIVILSIAFGIAFSGGVDAFRDVNTLLQDIRIASIAVVCGFAFHELAHRIVANRYGYKAEYYMSPIGLGIAIIVSLSGWILAAPGAVRIYGVSDDAIDSAEQREKLGKISLAGPMTNFIVALLFFLIGMGAAYFGYFIDDDSVFWQIVTFGVEINAWLAIFNMIPVWNLDGKDVFKWNKIAWFGIMLISVGLYAYMII